MQHITWRVAVIQPPTVARHCTKCGRTSEYRSTGQFRVNAQGRLLDVWLVYKCTRCNTTWNLTLHERVRPEALAEKLVRLQDNNAALALGYACDLSLLCRAGAPVHTGPVYRVEGPLPQNGTAHITLHCPHPCALRLAAILREKLGLSHRQLGQLVESGYIRCPQGDAPQRVRLRDKLEVSITL